MNNEKCVVAHINNSFFAGSETFIYNFISNLKRFHPICISWEIENLEKFHFKKEDMFKITFKRYSLDWFLYGSLRKFLNYDLYTKNIIKKKKVSLIHAHFGPNGVYSLMLKKSLKIPLITTFYGYDVSVVPNDERWIKKYHKLFLEGDLFLVEGGYMKEKLIDLGCPNEKIKIQRIGIPVDRINFRVRRPKKRTENVIIIFAGRFVEKKGLIYALYAIKDVRKKYNNFEFRVIGDGPLRSEIEKLIKVNKMEDYVKLLGFLSYDNYLKEMEKADIFIHPSITASNGDTEGGAPTTILEAQALGMPVISTYHADIPNVVLPGKSALLSKEKDVEDLSKNISYLIEEQDCWEKMGHYGRSFIEKYHNIKKEVYLLEEKYLSILKN